MALGARRSSACHSPPAGAPIGVGPRLLLRKRPSREVLGDWATSFSASCCAPNPADLGASPPYAPASSSGRCLLRGPGRASLGCPSSGTERACVHVNRADLHEDLGAARQVRSLAVLNPSSGSGTPTTNYGRWRRRAAGPGRAVCGLQATTSEAREPGQDRQVSTAAARTKARWRGCFSSFDSGKHQMHADCQNPLGLQWRSSRSRLSGTGSCSCQARLPHVHFGGLHEVALA